MFKQRKHTAAERKIGISRTRLQKTISRGDYCIQYSSDQLFGHASQQLFSDPGFNFFSIYGDFGELSEILNGHVREELVGTVQYLWPTSAGKCNPAG